MNNQTKLEFRLVPTKGVASGKGFRAEWMRKNEVIDMDAVIAEAQAKGAFFGISAGRARSDIEANPPDVDRTAHASILPPTAD